MIKRSLFFKIFPPPKYLVMPAVGVDISDRSVKFARLGFHGADLRLQDFAEEMLPPEIVKRGEIKNEVALTKFLQGIKEKYKLEHVAAALPEEQAYLLLLKSPVERKSEIYDNIELQLEEHVPIPATEAILDYGIVSSPTPEKKYFEVAVSVLPRNVVESYTRVFAGAGLKLSLLRIEACALARSLIADGDNGTYLIIDFGKTRTGFAIVSNQLARFSSTTGVGGDDLVAAVGKALNVREDEAREIKEKQGLLKTEKQEVYSALAPTLSALQDEIRKHYNWWEGHRDDGDIKHEKIGKIIMCGGDANIPGLVEYLSADLEIPVQLGNPWLNIGSFNDYIPPIPFNHSLRYAVALGLGIMGLNYKTYI